MGKLLYIAILALLAATCGGSGTEQPAAATETTAETRDTTTTTVAPTTTTEAPVTTTVPEPSTTTAAADPLLGDLEALFDAAFGSGHMVQDTTITWTGGMVVIVDSVGEGESALRAATNIAQGETEFWGAARLGIDGKSIVYADIPNAGLDDDEEATLLASRVAGLLDPLAESFLFQ